MVNTVKLVVLGDGGVGKTALTIMLCLNQCVLLLFAYAERCRSIADVAPSSFRPPDLLFPPSHSFIEVRPLPFRVSSVSLTFILTQTYDPTIGSLSPSISPPSSHPPPCSPFLIPPIEG